MAPSVLDEINQPCIVTARSPRRMTRGRGDDQMLRVFPGASSSVVDISNEPQFYPNTSHLQHNNLHNHRHLQFNHRQSPHLQGFANTPSDDTNMMDVQLPIV